MSTTTWQTLRACAGLGDEKPEDREPPVEGQPRGGRLRIKAQISGKPPDLAGRKQTA
jgi:hypothetical protein